MPGGQTANRAIIDPTISSLLKVVGVYPLGVSYTQWPLNGVNCWVAKILPGQNPIIGDIYTPLYSPITALNTLEGGTYATAPPAPPPLADSIAVGIETVNALADEKVTAAVGINSVAAGIISSNQYADLTAKLAFGTITPAEQSAYDALSAKNAAAGAVIAARDALISYLNGLTDPATAAAFDAANPPAGYSWPI